MLLEAGLVCFAGVLLAGMASAIIGKVAGLRKERRRRRRGHRPGSVPLERHRNVRAASAR